MINIGCERHSYDEWLADYEEIGRRNGYDDDEITDYGVWIKLAAARYEPVASGSAPNYSTQSCSLDCGGTATP